MKMSNKTYPPNNKEESKRIAEGFDRIYGKRDVLNKTMILKCSCGWKFGEGKSTENNFGWASCPDCGKLIENPDQRRE